jgi:hypothetical protein
LSLEQLIEKEGWNRNSFSLVFGGTSTPQNVGPRISPDRTEVNEGEVLAESKCYNVSDMRLYAFRLYAFALIACGLCVAQQNETLFTCGVHNGRAWRTMEFLEKINYVNGYFAGLQVARVLGVDRKVLADWEPSGATNSLDIVSALDKFFSDPLNAKFPILDGLHYIAIKDHGGTEAQLKEALSWARANAETECGTKK